MPWVGLCGVCVDLGGTADSVKPHTLFAQRPESSNIEGGYKFFEHLPSGM